VSLFIVFIVFIPFFVKQHAAPVVSSISLSRVGGANAFIVDDYFRMNSISILARRYPSFIVRVFDSCQLMVWVIGNWLNTLARFC
jgi:hypothetical protein